MESSCPDAAPLFLSFLLTRYEPVKMHARLGADEPVMFVRIDLSAELDAGFDQTLGQHRRVLVMDVV